MLIPRFWARGSVEIQSRGARPYEIRCWKGSAQSAEEAQWLAQEAAQRIADRVLRGEGFPDRYAYGQRPLREPILRELHDDAGELSAAVTRNAYGAQVLNAAQAMFIDVDIPRQRQPGVIARLLGSLLGRKTASLPPREAALSRLTDWLVTRGDWSLRLYSTHAGLRLVATHALFQPGQPQVEADMREVGCDPLYLRLCRSQESFRARLTPKPFRCGLPVPPVKFPFESPDEEQHMAQWLQRYEQVSRGYATCKLLGTRGQGQVHPALESIVDLHDEATGAHTDLQLA